MKVLTVPKIESIVWGDSGEAITLVAVDPAAKSLTFWGFSGKCLDFPKS